jgi:hypothetical protein
MEGSFLGWGMGVSLGLVLLCLTAGTRRWLLSESTG